MSSGVQRDERNGSSILHTVCLSSGSQWLNGRSSVRKESVEEYAAKNTSDIIRSGVTSKAIYFIPHSETSMVPLSLTLRELTTNVKDGTAVSFSLDKKKGL
ncbi:unnamed protein product [Lepeophtheirus salmonis]|uniref:(salmon louse) hypothetical protein n=1 Tax=Lepeophtheirus salmonis TaxID=72036 RepID=A0A7R8H579_LEPSM|nr:unnamed protein product [Lepeophtheirus salmonis]CAF2876212.1 unnamed protein product [Lepeophtheirus salmonis]